MKATNRFWRYLVMPLSFAGMLSISSAAELNPAAVIYKLPDQIPWSPVDARGAQNAVVVSLPRKNLELDALVEILNNKRFITCHSYVQSEVNMLMHVADSMGFRVNTFTHIL